MVTAFFDIGHRKCTELFRYSRKWILLLPRDRGKIVVISVFYSNKCHNMIITLSMVTNLGPGKK